ncbi:MULTISPECIES: acyl-CoA thioesterase [Cysteiniphilum]|uniref:Thioesterase n=1 Tax=Cysteiniphilum litorale TaxID=2056700 RepID=A0A8J3E8N2_9GAMM|nr:MULTISPECIES: acyl-CoA thioesterase [Cysteiniphilum]GGG00190.1 thioesterase [Cysteiniphilum litorale]
MQIFKTYFNVMPEHIDANKHVSNIVYIKWMQDIAVMHSDACGWDTKRYHQNHCTWVAKTHFIDYIKQVFLNEVIEARTWVDEIKRSTALRKYEFINQLGEIVAKAETNWVFINTETQRTQRVLPEVREDFERFRSSEYSEAADLLNSDEPSL